MAKESNIQVNIPKSAQKDLAKVKMDVATTELKKRIEDIKNIEKESGSPLSSEKVLGYMADIEKEFLATKIYNKLQALMTEIQEKLDAYDDPINKMKKQVTLLTRNHADFVTIIKVSTKTVKAVAWVIGAIVTVFTLINIIARMAGR